MRPATYLDAMKQHQGRWIDKWSHYPKIYERHLAGYRDKPVRVLEIGVFHGGSLEVLARYLGPQASLVGFDIDPRCKAFETEQIAIEIGDQGNAERLREVLDLHGPFDIIIDDGSHFSAHMILTHQLGWPHLRDGGVFMVEDTHSCYRHAFGGGWRAPQSFIEYSKLLVDDLHGLWQADPLLSTRPRYTLELGSLHFYDSIVVMEKELRSSDPLRFRASAGFPSYPIPQPHEQEEARRNLHRL
ncbi:class I SAM-dependent methyltransferase [Chitinimonas sp.]|uniref:class I SAM-dependent methyltransferase n=1 Tax=Chitinimonas sp. TaxID=1934313 RepID=UPI0035B3BC5A